MATHKLEIILLEKGKVIYKKKQFYLKLIFRMNLCTYYKHNIVIVNNNNNLQLATSSIVVSYIEIKKFSVV